MRRSTIEEIKKIAIERVGLCLSNEYVNNSSKLIWKCKCGNIWESPSSSIKNGHWCPRCSKCEKLTIESMKKIAQEKKGECLSNIYKNANKKLKWMCNICHKIWWATPHNVKRGTWCPRCSHREKSTILEMKKIAHDRGGKCLSHVYVNVNQKLIWKCNTCGNIWETSAYHVRKGTWCPQCAHNKKKTLKNMRELAHSKGGYCLSKKYSGVSQNILWKCGTCKRTWKATPSNIQVGTWCPYCLNKIEEMCRNIFESIFNKRFPKCRPIWLKSKKTGRKMELDGFNKNLKIAFEYNGIQHYEIVSLFKGSDKTVKNYRKKELLKKKLCRKMGISLIIIPPINISRPGFPYLTRKTLKNFILSRLKCTSSIKK